MKTNTQESTNAQQPTIVLIPGVLCDQRVYEQVIQTLSPAYRCDICIFDLTKTLSSFINHVMSLSEGPLVLIGHSMGGKLAFLTACANPERVQGICIINSSVDPYSEQEAKKRRLMIEKAREHPCSSIINDFIKKCTLNPNDSVRKMMVGHLDWLVHQKSFLLSSRLKFDDIAKLHCPALLIHSDHDEIFDTGHVYRMAEVLSNSQVNIVENSGHMTTMEQPEVVSRLIKDWLDRRCLFV